MMSSEQRRSEFCSSAGNISAATKVIKKSSGRSAVGYCFDKTGKPLEGAASYPIF